MNIRNFVHKCTKAEGDSLMDLQYKSNYKKIIDDICYFANDHIANYRPMVAALFETEQDAWDIYTFKDEYLHFSFFALDPDAKYTLSIQGKEDITTNGLLIGLIVTLYITKSIPYYDSSPLTAHIIENLKRVVFEEAKDEKLAELFIDLFN